MNTATYAIAGGDYESGGTASKQLKEMLKRIGADPKSVRRTMIAAYEAEMNVVIHARRGVMKVAVAPSQVDVAITDEGPGIPNIGEALREGFSTAPPQARELGFGAGMGLPNIKKNSDRFSVQSAVGRGTQIRFTILLQHEEGAGSFRHAVGIEGERCVQCLKCLHACPTGAMRIRDGRPGILDHVCINCTSCAAACGTGALTLPGLREMPAVREDTVLVLPAAFLEQFGAGTGPRQVLEAVRKLGFRNIRLLEEWESALRTALMRFTTTEEGKTGPVLAPVCPAVLHLIQTRFPSLLGQVAPFLTPVEAAREELTATHAVFLSPCASQYAALRPPSLLTRVDTMLPAVFRDAAYPHIEEQGRGPRAEGRGMHGPRPSTLDPRVVTGMRHVMNVLDLVENGLMNDCAAIELYACDQGCFGSPAWTEDPFVSRPRYEQSEVDAYLDAPSSPAGAVRRVAPLEARPGFRLDSDMQKAIAKLARIDAIARSLPGRDCGVCGAPACAVLAEDIVMGRAEISACVYREGA